MTEYELILFEQPGGYFCINGKRYNITGHDIRLYKPGDFVYSYRFHDVYVIHFTVGNGICENSELNSLPAYIHDTDYNTMKNLFINLIQAHINHNIIAQNAFFWNMVMELKMHNTKTLDTHSSANIAEKAKQYLKQHYHESVTLKTLGEAIYMHPNYIHQVFSETFGLTPSEYLLEQRLMHGRELLLNRNMSIEQIAHACGFCNSSYFIRKFKEKHLLTPKEYRKKATTVLYGQM